jgi:hypothetical protein
MGAAWWGAPGVLIGQAAGGVVFAIIALLLLQKVLIKHDPGQTPGIAEDVFSAATQPYFKHQREHILHCPKR